MQIFFLLILLHLRGRFEAKGKNAEKMKIYLQMSKIFCI